jgi:hypothetical protein
LPIDGLDPGLGAGETGAQRNGVPGVPEAVVKELRAGVESGQWATAEAAAFGSAGNMASSARM